MARSGIDGLFYFMTGSALFLTLVAVGFSLIKASPLHLRRSFEILAPQAAPLSHDSLGPCDDLPEDPIGAATEGH